MKILPNFIRNHLPISRKAHADALAKVHTQAHENEAYLSGQLRQVTAANIRLERKLHLNTEAE